MNNVTFDSVMKSIDSHIEDGKLVTHLPTVLADAYSQSLDMLGDFFSVIWDNVVKYTDTKFVTDPLTHDAITLVKVGKYIEFTIDLNEHVKILITQHPMTGAVLTPNVSQSPFVSTVEKAIRLGDDGLLFTLNNEDFHMHVIAKKLFADCTTNTLDVIIKDGHFIQLSPHKGNIAIRTTSPEWIQFALKERALEKYPYLTDESMDAEVINQCNSMNLVSSTIEHKPTLYADVWTLVITIEQYKNLLGHMGHNVESRKIGSFTVQ